MRKLIVIFALFFCISASGQQFFVEPHAGYGRLSTTGSNNEDNYMNALNIGGRIGAKFTEQFGAFVGGAYRQFSRNTDAANLRSNNLDLHFGITGETRYIYLDAGYMGMQHNKTSASTPILPGAELVSREKEWNNALFAGIGFKFYSSEIMELRLGAQGVYFLKESNSNGDHQYIISGLLSTRFYL